MYLYKHRLHRYMYIHTVCGFKYQMYIYIYTYGIIEFPYVQKALYALIF